MMGAPDLLSIAALDRAAVEDILDLSVRDDLGRPLAGKGVAMLFQKPSARTRNSMEMAVVQLGGHPVPIAKEEVGLGSRETAEDVARSLACYHSLIAARVTNHADLEAMADATETPILNMLSDRAHPLQALADMLTIKQLLGRTDGARVTYVGDADNNVCRSLAEACALLGARLTVAAPDGYGLSASELALLNAHAGEVRQLADPAEAVAGAEIVYTDVWVSMGQDSEAEARGRALGAYQVNDDLLARANQAWFLHCLPARRGEEVSAEVLEGPRSAIWQQAANRMHTARGAMAWMMRPEA